MQPQIRNGYPFARAPSYPKNVDFNGPAAPAQSATDARTGTEEKIAVLAERAAQNGEL